MDPFEESIIKPDELLREDDVKIILENKDKWNDEEKERFATLTEEGFKKEEAPAEEQPAADTTVTPSTEEQPLADLPKAEEKEVLQIDSKKEIDEYVEQKKKELAEAGATKAEQKEAGEQIIEFWKYAKNEEGQLFIPKENSPADWNHAFTSFLNYLKQNPDVLLADLAPHIRNQILKLESIDAQQFDNINKQYDTELTTLYQEGKLPDPKSKEGREIDYKLTTLAIQYGLSSMKDAYNLWSQMAPDQGGGFGYKPNQAKAEVKEEKKEQSSMQKRLASKVGGGGSGGNAPKSEGAVKYKDIHEQSLDQLLADEL